MSKSFKGRVVTPGRVKAEALVSHGGFNTLASFQMALMFGDKQAVSYTHLDVYKRHSYAMYIGESLKAAGVDSTKLPLRVGIFGAEAWSENCLLYTSRCV